MSVKTTDSQTALGFEYAVSQQVAHLSSQDQSFDGRTIKINGREMVNFGNCSYLGLNLHPKVKAGALEAVERYSPILSSSRAYVGLGLTDELEGLLSQIFGGPTLAALSTTMGHLGVLPVIVSGRDAIIMDQQVHASVQMAVSCVKGSNPTVHVEKIKHNHLEMLENRLQKLTGQHEKVWYMIDGVYSMFGDGAPVPAILELMDRYENLYIYCDDAHGMSWTGPNGAGYFRQLCGPHPRVVLATSLGKAFGSGGGAFVFPTEAMKKQVRMLGGTFVFSMPPTPPMVGAAIASAKIHLSDEIYVLQRALRARIEHFVSAARALKLPLVGSPETPIQFVAVGKTERTLDISSRLLHIQGLYINPSVYPVVPPGKAGLRITITNHQTFQDLTNLVQAIREELDYQTQLDRAAKPSEVFPMVEKLELEEVFA
jgi:7-keto-8-aminopelargonate synthetase-like enzyme